MRGFLIWCIRNGLSGQPSQMSSNKIIPKVLNLHSCNPSLIKGILGPLSRCHHQIGVTVNAVSRSNSQAGSLAFSGSYFIKGMCKLGLVTYPQKCISFTCDVPKPRTFSSIPRETQPVKISSSQGNKKHLKQYLEDLLSQLLVDQDARRIEETLKELEEMGCNYDAKLYMKLVLFFCNQNNLSKAWHYKERLQAEFPDFYIYDNVIINLAALLASRRKYDEAEKLISELSPEYTVEEDIGIFNSVSKLLTGIEKTGDIERARRMLDLLMKKGYYTGNPSNKSLRILFKMHLKKNDMAGLVEEFIQIVKKYQTTPGLGLIFEGLIRTKEMGKLQKVMDAARQLKDEETLLIILVKAFLRMKRFEEALTIFKTSGLIISEDQLYDLLEHIVDGRQIHVLEEFVKVRPDLFEINKDILYYHLIRACVLEENVEKALELWSIMQKEGIEPSESTLTLLGNFLTQMGQSIPFSFSETVGSYTFKDGSRSDNRKSVKKTDLQFDNKVDLLQKSKEMEDFLDQDRLTDAKKVCDDLVSVNMYPNSHVLKKYFQTLSDVGDIEALTSLEQKLPERALKLNKLYSFKHIVQINLGLSEEFIKDLEENTQGHRAAFPARAFMFLLDKHPENLERLMCVSDLYHEIGFPFPRNLIWIWLMKNGRVDEAKEILESTPKFRMWFHFKELTDKLKESKNEALSQAMLDQVKSASLSFSSKGHAYSSHIDLLLSVSKLDEALNTFKESQESLLLSDLQRSTLELLESELTSKGLPVPFILPKEDESRRSYISSGDRS